MPKKMKNYFVVFGPPRSGTNYLSELILLNTPGPYPKIANLDKAPAIPRSTRVDFLHKSMGSKHFLRDKRLELKFLKDNINIFIARSDFALWVNSYGRFVSNWDKNYSPNENFVKKCYERYINYFNFLSEKQNQINCGVIFLENLNKDFLNIIAQKMNFKLNEKLVNVSYRMAPGQRKLQEYKKITYSKESNLSKLVFDLYNRKIGDNKNPIDFLEMSNVNTSNLFFL